MRATVRLNGSVTPVAADPAWVIVAPPDFAPAIENVMTLYDAVYSVMAGFDPAARCHATRAKVSFTKDIYPILRRVSNMHWVSKLAGQSRGRPANHFISQRQVSCPAMTPQDTAAAPNFPGVEETQRRRRAICRFCPETVDDPEEKFPAPHLL